MAAEGTDQYRTLVSNLCWAVEENRRIEMIKSIRHLTGCSSNIASDIHAAFTNFPRDPSPMPEAELRKSLSPNAPAEASKWAADYVKSAASKVDEEPTMADMLYSHIKSGDDYDAPSPQETEYDVIVWDPQYHKPHVHRYWNKEDAYNSAKWEHANDPTFTVYVARIIAQPYTTTEMEEFK